MKSRSLKTIFLCKKSALAFVSVLDQVSGDTTDYYILKKDDLKVLTGGESEGVGCLR